MDNSKPLSPTEVLLDDLQSIRDLLGDLDPPCLTDALDADGIPLLLDVVSAPSSGATAPRRESAFTIASEAELRKTLQQAMGRDNEINRLDTELRAAAQLLLQDVVDEFAPQMEAELKRRLQERLELLLPPRR
jgi:hypothetical protein